MTGPGCSPCNVLWSALSDAREWLRYAAQGCEDSAEREAFDRALATIDHTLGQHYLPTHSGGIEKLAIDTLIRHLRAAHHALLSSMRLHEIADRLYWTMEHWDGDGEALFQSIYFAHEAVIQLANEREQHFGGPMNQPSHHAAPEKSGKTKANCCPVCGTRLRLNVVGSMDAADALAKLAAAKPIITFAVIEPADEAAR